MRWQIVGKVGEVHETVRVGEQVLERDRLWRDAFRYVDLLRSMGEDASETHPLPRAETIPDIWIVADAPRPTLIGSGLHRDIVESVETMGRRLIVLGGCLSFGGQQGAGGWHNDPVLPVTSRGDDTVERPAGIRADHDQPGNGAPVPAWPSYGYNSLRSRRASTVLARFESNPALVSTPDRRVVVWASDLLPHWGPRGEESATAHWLLDISAWMRE